MISGDVCCHGPGSTLVITAVRQDILGLVEPRIGNGSTFAWRKFSFSNATYPAAVESKGHHLLAVFCLILHEKL